MYMWDVNSQDDDGGLWWELSNCNVPKNTFQQCMNAHNQFPDLIEITFDHDPGSLDANGVEVGKNYGVVKYNQRLWVL